MDFQKEEIDEILNIFQQESTDIISSIEEEVFELEKNGYNSKIAMQLFRNVHSLKGSARMLNFENIQNLAHKLEDVISLIKEEKMAMTSEISDKISKILDFITKLISEAVLNKKEIENPKTQEYIEILKKIVNDYNKKELLNKKEIDDSLKDDSFIVNFEEVEKILINILTQISLANKNKEFDRVISLKSDIEKLNKIISLSKIKKLKSISYATSNLVNCIENFKKVKKKEVSILSFNKIFTILIDYISKFASEINLEKKDYYKIVEEKILDKSPVNISQKKDAINELIKKIDVLEKSSNEIDKFISEFEKYIKEKKLNEKDNQTLETIFQNIKHILSNYQKSNSPITPDISMIIKETLVSIKSQKRELIEECSKKVDVIKTMVNFQHRKKIHDNFVDKNISNQNLQNDILNSITNAQIKTLRVDSTKLDNLVDQIGELIVSKIKTNEQLSLTKKINNDLIEWQKNFAKMNYYIKYFEKKYLSNPNNKMDEDIKRILAYNKQLSSLGENHSEQISILIKEASLLYKQLQESEAKLISTTNEIENMVKNIRILPLSTIFQLFPRMVHNIAKEQGKKIELIINGSDTTADKTIIEELKIPLIHIIRNSIDHGIEKTKERVALSKNPIGQITISATHKDNNIVIDVRDDGRGLDIDKIKQKALDKNLLTQEEINLITPEDLTNLIFYPGFSTQDFITELSGRGLGLDIVSNKINQLQGRVDIFSQVHQGTTVRMVIPSTVATKKVFIIEENNQFFALETSVIKTIVRINSDDIFEKDNNNYYVYNGEVVAIYALSQILNLNKNKKDSFKYTVMIIETDNISFGIIVEKLVCDQEIVHKKLAPPLYKVKHVSGITTLANGEACLILSVGDIINTINSKIIRNKTLKRKFVFERQDNKKYKILIVDDSHTTRMLQTNILTKQGYNVVNTTNPIIALEKLKHEDFDLIISDVEMPEMNGFEFAKEVRKLQNYFNIPFMIMSSKNKEDYQKEIKEMNILHFIEKNSFKQEDLINYTINALKTVKK